MRNYYKTSTRTVLVLLLFFALGPQFAQADCPDDCASCSSEYFCTRCEDGYYAPTASGKSRYCSACQSPCQTCDSPALCTSCQSGYSLDGSSCVIPSQKSSSSGSSNFLGLFLGIFFGVGCLICIAVGIYCYCRCRRLAREKAKKVPGRFFAQPDENLDTSLPGSSSRIPASQPIDGRHGSNPRQNPQGGQPVRVMVPMYYFPTGNGDSEPQGPLTTADINIGPPRFQTLNLQQPVPYTPPLHAKMAGGATNEYPSPPVEAGASNLSAPKPLSDKPDSSKMEKGTKRSKYI